MPELKNETKSDRSILIIEDNKEILDSLKLALEEEGFNIRTANNGKEGLEKLTIQPLPCAIMLDLMMPVMNGWEFLEEMKKDSSFLSIPIIILSALGDKSSSLKNALGDKSLKLNIQEYYQKPIDLNSLLSTIHKHCG